LQPLPPPPAPGSARCSGCSKVLMKGQTAFQRKGSTQLFCSTVCLTGYLPPTSKARTCYQCLKQIVNPKDVIMAPVDVNTYMHFCGQFCLALFGSNKKSVPQTAPQIDKPACRICKVTTKIEHEVTHMGNLHRLCSDRCFALWRAQRLLAMNCCESCSMYCKTNSSSCQTLTIDGAQLNFCSPTCVVTYKQTCSKTTHCGNCNSVAIVSSTLMETDHRGKVSLYCSTACVNISRPPKHKLTGTPFPCTHCNVNAVPQYHLAMADGTIRSFCSYNCVTTFRQTEHSQPPDQTNGPSSTLRSDSQHEPPSLSTGPGAGSYEQAPGPPPYKGPTPVPASSKNTTSSPASQVPGIHPTHSSQVPMPYLPPSTPDLSGRQRYSARLSCQQCNKRFSSKPLLFSYKGRVLQFCHKLCNEQYKTKHNIVARCDSCALEKVVHDVMYFNQKEKIFCSESCKLLFKHDLTWKKKETWKLCAYCSSVNTHMHHSHFGGKMEEFCTAECMSQYTVLFYGMGRCGCCRRQGYLLEKLQCSSSVRHFCNLPCLLEYCAQNFNPKTVLSNGAILSQTQPPPHAPVQPHRSKRNPVIADVVSLANGSECQPHVNADTALTGALPTSNSIGKSLDHASTQTDALRVPVARRKPMKNKAILCKPFTLDREVQCAATQASETPAGKKEKVKVIVLPVPVPVFIPVPMNMYSQYLPVAMAMPLPLPVPIVVSSSTAVPLKKKMKDIGIQCEATAGLVREKEKSVSHADQVNTCSLDTASEAISTPPSRGEESAGRESNTRPVESPSHQKVGIPCLLDPSISTQEQGNPKDVDPLKTSVSSNVQRPSSPMIDLEADFPVELFVAGAVKDPSPAQPQRGLKRSHDGFSPRKRSRRRTGSLDPLSPGPSKLHHMYGVNAWRDWVAQRNKHRDRLTDALFRPVILKEDLLLCNSSELSYGLCRFIKEVRRPSGEAYTPDSIFYLCLGIQQYLFEMGRIENIFTDDLYSRFAMEVTGMLHHWRPDPLASGLLCSRVAEDFLWECKQLGAYSPVVLLNTLLFFCTKALGLTTLAQHQRLTFSNFTGCTRPACTGTSAHLHYRAPVQGEDTGTVSVFAEALTFPAKRKLEDEEVDIELPENTVNPLRCPVRLYEFYLSKCPEMVMKRSTVFYLQPEQTLQHNSLCWYTSKPLEGATLESMLTRILAVRELHQDQEVAPQQHLAPSPGSTDDDSSQEGQSQH
ncbi:zinc finger MYM-type protein 4, partial [Aplochiton taeniatus]